MPILVVVRETRTERLEALALRGCSTKCERKRYRWHCDWTGKRGPDVLRKWV